MHTQKLIAFITPALFGLLSACNVQEGGDSPASSPSDQERSPFPSTADRPAPVLGGGGDKEANHPGNPVGFDANDLGAAVRQHAPDPRPRHALGELDRLQAFECLGIHRFRPPLPGPSGRGLPG